MDIPTKAATAGMVAYSTGLDFIVLKTFLNNDIDSFAWVGWRMCIAPVVVRREESICLPGPAYAF